jgi:hypothetical protein
MKCSVPNLFLMPCVQSGVMVYHFDMSERISVFSIKFILNSMCVRLGRYSGVSS